MVLGADLVQHAQHLFVGAAVQRAGEGRNGRRGGGVRVGLGAAHRAHGAGAAILLVIGVQDEQHLERARQHRVGGVLGLGAFPQHVHVVLGVAQLRIGIDVGQAQAVPVGVGGQGGHLADQPDDLLAAALGVGDVARLGIEGGERRHGAHQNAHGVGVVVEAVHEFLDVLVDQGVVHHIAVPQRQLSAVGSSPCSSR